MKIKQIKSQNRRDFTAELECETCGNVQMLRDGYDDAFYHKNVIPSIKCNNCGKSAPENYRPLSTKYNENEIV